jgi:hypothetical protein
VGLLPSQNLLARLSAPGSASTVVTGLRAPPPPATRGVGSYQPTISQPSVRQSFTGSPSGGAPGANFGPPGVAGAPVPVIGSGGITIGSLTLTPGMLVLLGVVAVGGYLVLR